MATPTPEPDSHTHTHHATPLRARLYDCDLSHVDLAILQAMCEGNSTGQFNFIGLRKIAALAKLSRRCVQQALQGSPCKCGHAGELHREHAGACTRCACTHRNSKRPGLIARRVLVKMAEPNAASRLPTTYRIQIEALQPCPRMARWRDNRRQLQLPFPPDALQLAKWQMQNPRAWSVIMAKLKASATAAIGASMPEEARIANAIALAHDSGMPRHLAQFLFLAPRPK